MGKITCIDTEHSDHVYKPWETGFYLTCIGIIEEENGIQKVSLIWFDHRDVGQTVDGIITLQNIIDTSSLLVFHNAKHDINILKYFGIEFNDVPIHCTMVADYLIEGQDKMINYSLNSVAERYGLGQKHDEVKEYWNQGVHTYDIPDWLLGPYCIKDCILTLDIYHKQIPRIDEAGLWKVVNLQNEYTYALAEMEYNGLFFDVNKAQEIVKEFQDKAQNVADQILKGFDFAHKINLASSQQLSALLYGGLLKMSWKEWYIHEYKTKPYSRYYEKTFKEEVQFEGLGFIPDKRTKGKNGYYKVDKDTIELLIAKKKRQKEIKKLLIEYSKYFQVIKSLQGNGGNKGLVSKVCEDGCIHPHMNQTIAATGRLTSSNPNGQNLPRGNTSPIKLCITARHDGIMQVDLSQIEWRDAAWLSQDPVMIQEINAGADQHIATVKDLMEMRFISKEDKESKQNRDHAKVFNFRMIYGGSKWGFYLDVNMPSFSLKKWQFIIDQFFKKYVGLKKFHKECVKFVWRNGYLKLPTGRWFKFHKRELRGGEWGYAENQIKNYPVQGMSGGDILPLMAVIIRRGIRKMGLKSKLILTVHDSILFDYVEEEREQLARLCYRVGNNLGKYIENYYGLDWNVKLECEVEAGPNYGSMKFIKPETVGV